MKAALVEPLAFADREELELVVVVRDERDLGVDRLPIHREAGAVAIASEQEQGTELREGIPSPPVVLAVVDEERVEAKRDVVQERAIGGSTNIDPALRAREGVEGADWVVAVEAEVAREVVPSPERHADERHVALDRDLCHRRERSVAARDADRVGLCGAREPCGIVVGPEDARVDAALVRLGLKFLRARAVVARARIDQEELSYASTGSRPSERSNADLGCAPIAAAAGSPSLKSTIAGIEAIP